MLYAEVAGLPRPLSRLIFGTGSLRDLPEAPDLLDRILACGCTTFDTARIYGGVERCLGAWIRTRGLADAVTIITKGGHPSNRSRLRRSDLAADLDASHEALGLDVLDLVLLHRDDPDIPAAEIVDMLEELRGTHAVRAWGASNWTAARLAEAQCHAARTGSDGFRVSSPQFSLTPWTRAPWTGCVSLSGPYRHQDRDWYRTNRVPVLAWSALAAGFLANDQPAAPGREKRTRGWQDAIYASHDNDERLARARDLAGRLGVATVRVALAYLFCQPFDVCAITSTRHAAHFRQGAEALQIQLSAEQLRWLALEHEREG
jgi:aryl-alcohol dehydrogenase-like predicted oxidoreductase